MGIKRKITQAACLLLAASMVNTDPVSSEGVSQFITDAVSSAAEAAEEQEKVPEKSVMEVKSAVVLENDAETDELVINGGSLNLAGYAMKVNGDVRVNGGTLNIAGGTLEIAGNLIINNTVSVSGGNLTVGGDLRIQSEYIDGEGKVSYYESYSGSLIMTDEADYVLVNGGFHTSKRYSSWDQLTAGILEIKGDFEEIITNHHDNFVAHTDHKVILSGTEKQTVSIQGTTSGFAVLELKNTSAEGVEFLTPVNYNTLIKNSTVLILPEGERLGWKLEKDEVLEDLILSGGTLDLNGHSLTVKGDFVQKGGIAKLNGGKLSVSGNYSVAGAARLNMTNEEDKLSVAGNFETSSSYSHENLLKAGKIEIGGNLDQYNGSNMNFRTSGTCEVILNGKAAQSVNIRDCSNSALNILKVTNASEEGVIFKSQVNITGKLYDTESVVSGSAVYLSAEAELADNSWAGSLRISTDRVLENDIKTGQKLYIDGGTLNLNGHKLETGGDLILNGILNINGGKLTTDGDLRIQGEYIDGEGNASYYESYSGSLIMTNEADYVLVNGGFHTSKRYSSWNQLTAGVLEIKGDFEEFVSNDHSNFIGSDSHKTILSGDSKQTVRFDGSTSGFAKLELKNTSEEGVEFLNPVNYSELIKNSTVLVLPDGQRLGWKLEKDEVIDGDLMLVGDVLDLNGHKLTVSGNFNQNGGTVKLNGGQLGISGNYSIASSGKLNMTNEKDKLIVDGNFETSSSYSHENLLKAGKIEIGGNLDQYSGSNMNFRTSGTCEVILNGKAVQNITIRDCSNSALNILKITNTSEEGVVFKSQVNITGKLYDTNSAVSGSAVYLSADAELTDNSWAGSLRISTDRVLENDIKTGQKLYIDGGTLNLNGHKLETGGDLILNGTLNVNGGKLITDGDLRIQGEYIDGEGNVSYYESYSGSLIMTNEADYVLVNGSFRTCKRYGAWNQLTAGVLEIKGDFEEFISNDHANFIGSDSHKTILSGDSKQTVRFDGSTSGFAQLELNNTSEEGVEFLTAVSYSSLKVNDTVLKLPDGQRLGWKLEKDEVIDGDLTIVGDTLDLNGHSLTVNGNLSQRGGFIKLNGGKLSVSGNFSILNSGRVVMADKADVLAVAGDFSTSSSYSHKDLLTCGRIEIGGDIKQIAGSASNFRTSGTCEVVLNGNKQQKVVMDRADESLINILKITNTSEEGVYFSASVTVCGKLYDTASKLQGNAVILGETAILADNSWSGDLRINTSRVLNNDISVGGTLYHDNGTLDINGYKLNIGGNLILNNVLFVNNGCIIVGKDFRIQSEYINNEGVKAYTESWSGNLVMKCPDDYICVNGDFHTTARYSSGGNLVDGILEIKGNFTQNSSYSRDNFIASDSHKVILSGSKLQKVSFAGTESKFNILEITQDISEYKFSHDELWNELIKASADTKAPSVPGTPETAEKNAVMIKLNWKESADDTGVRGYDIYRDGVRIANTDKNEFTDTGLVPDTEYVYSISAYDSSRNSSALSPEFKVSTSKDKEAPSVPSALKKISQTQDSVKLSWAFSTDNYRLEKYMVYRNGKLITETGENELSYEDKEIENGIYKYTVTAVDIYGNESEQSSELTIDLMPPEVPDEISCEYTENSIKLNWTPASAEDFSTFTVYRKSSKDKDFVKLISLSDAEYEDKNIELGETYIYRLNASDTTGNVSTFSKEFTAAIKEDKTAPVITAVSPSLEMLSNNTHITVSYSDNFVVSALKAEISEFGADKWSTLYAAESVSGNVYSFIPDTASLKTGKYDIRISVSDTSGNRSEYFTAVSEYHVHSIEQPVLELSGKGGHVQLSWSTTEDETLSEYKLYRKKAGEESFALIDTVKQNAYTDENTEEGIMYSYYITAVDIYGNIVSSEISDVSVTKESDYSKVKYGYTVKDGYVIITDSDIKADKIIIPREIEGLPVKYIGDMAFRNSAVTEVVLPETIVKIGYSSFENCTALKSVNIPESVELICDRAFLNCTALKSLSVAKAELSGNAVCGAYTDENNAVLSDSSFIIKASLGSSGQTYAESAGLVFVPDDCMYMSSENEVRILKYTGSAENISIPEYIDGKSVTEISASSFKGNETLRSIVIPQSVKKIGSYAFMNCKNLSDISFPQYTVEETGADIICNTPYLSSLSGDYKVICGNILYRYTGNNINVIIPDEVSIIGCDAFADCDFIENISVSDKTEKIFSGAFFGCENIKEIIIPDSVKYIGDYAFSCCYSLENAQIPENAEKGTEIFFNCLNMQ